MKSIKIFKSIITILFCAAFLTASNQPGASIEITKTKTKDKTVTIDKTGTTDNTNILDKTNTMEVTATAYNSLPYQTTKIGPDIAAWGDKLKPGMKCIAVSRDLIPLGLDHGTKVTLEGFEGTYIVLDKMNKRWTNKIDVYMGVDVQAALNFGVKNVNITWVVE